jgi:hypothetical protein
MPRERTTHDTASRARLTNMTMALLITHLSTAELRAGKRP